LRTAHLWLMLVILPGALALTFLGMLGVLIYLAVTHSDGLGLLGAATALHGWVCWGIWRNLMALSIQPKAAAPQPRPRPRSADEAVQAALDNAPEMFHHARHDMEVMLAARARIQAECPHKGVAPGAYCDACQGRAPLGTDKDCTPEEEPPGAA